jgi:hypothetical protein
MTGASIRTGRFGLVRLLLTEPHCPPFQPDAVTVAQDRWLLLDAGTPVCDTQRGYRSLARAAGGSGGERPGSVLVRRGGQPVRLWAVIHDLDATPGCRREWIASALDGVLREVQRRRLRTLELPPLGCADGVVSAAEFLVRLGASIRNTGGVSRLQVWIPLSGTLRAAACNALDTLDF